MGTGRLHLAVLAGLILLSLYPAERCSGAAGVFMEPQLRARAGDSVLLQCLFLDPDSKGGEGTQGLVAGEQGSCGEAVGKPTPLSPGHEERKFP